MRARPAGSKTRKTIPQNSAVGRNPDTQINRRKMNRVSATGKKKGSNGK